MLSLFQFVFDLFNLVTQAWLLAYRSLDIIQKILSALNPACHVTGALLMSHKLFWRIVFVKRVTAYALPLNHRLKMAAQRLPARLLQQLLHLLDMRQSVAQVLQSLRWGHLLKSLLILWLLFHS